MIADLTVLPLGHDPHISTLLAEILQDIRRQEIRYQVTATSTCLEGSWDQITHAAKRTHTIARKKSPHVVTLLKIEDDVEATNLLQSNIASVEQKAEAEAPLVSTENLEAMAPAPS